MEPIIRYFKDLERLAECASRIDLRKYKGTYRYESVQSMDSSEQGAYFCAVSKERIPSLMEVFPFMLIHDLHEDQEWSKEQDPYADLSRSEWKASLRKHWIPTYLAVKDCGEEVAHKFVTEEAFKKNWLPIAEQIAASALSSPIVSIVRYGMIDAWNFSNYVIETTTEYVDFQYWTTA